MSMLAEIVSFASLVIAVIALAIFLKMIERFFKKEHKRRLLKITAEAAKK